MKKIIALTSILCSFLLAANAQLENTQWKGTIKLPTREGDMAAVKVTWDFQKDTMKVIYDNGMPTDVMTYKMEKGTVTCLKVSGSVPCDNQTPCLCAFQIKNDQLFISRIQDACKARASADISQPFDRVK